MSYTQNIKEIVKYLVFYLITFLIFTLRLSYGP